MANSGPQPYPAAILLVLVVAGTGAFFHCFQIAVQQLIHPNPGLINAILQPGVCLGVRLPLPGPSRLGAGKGTSAAVLLDVDLPPFLGFKPFCGIGSLCHIFHPLLPLPGARSQAEVFFIYADLNRGSYFNRKSVLENRNCKFDIS